MDPTAEFEKFVREVFNGNIDDIAVALHLMSPHWTGGSIRIPDTPTVVWQADDGSASLVLNPDATIEVHTNAALNVGQLLALEAAIRHVQPRLLLAIGARAMSTLEAKLNGGTTP
ncbi:hypothetical protein F8M49_22440 [Rhodococcus zopfii]|uniref:Uncharacterized protein n=1 Tax=Rhodococcus zopfii TaxID=43772 RepID=A0ABU3WTW3_9NOCA|nr:hypothetical protein [Rhodococcus zopfii]